MFTPKGSSSTIFVKITCELMKALLHLLSPTCPKSLCDRSWAISFQFHTRALMWDYVNSLTKIIIVKSKTKGGNTLNKVDHETESSIMQETRRFSIIRTVIYY